MNINDVHENEMLSVRCSLVCIDVRHLECTVFHAILKIRVLAKYSAPSTVKQLGRIETKILATRGSLHLLCNMLRYSNIFKCPYVSFFLSLHFIFACKFVILFNVSVVVLSRGPSNSCWISRALISSSKADWRFPSKTKTSLRETCDRAVS